MGAQVDRVITNGTFSIDGEDFDVENNIWLVGDADEVLVVDAAHEAAPIIEAVAGRRVVAVLCTHGHNDHINVAVEVAVAVGAPIWLHPEDTMLWEVVNPDRPVDAALADGLNHTACNQAVQALPDRCCAVAKLLTEVLHAELRAGENASRKNGEPKFLGDTLGQRR